MKCSRLILNDRKTYKQIRHEDSRRLCMSRPAPILSQTPRAQTNPLPVPLSISDISLPENFEYKPGSKRWTNKRPRLKSHRQNPSKPEMKFQDLQFDSFSESDSAQLEIEEIVEEYEIDEHVLRLIEQASEYDARITEEKLEIVLEKTKKRHKKKKNKKKNKKINEIVYDSEVEIKPRVARTINLSRAASPQTEQVIRVDVVSNYSVAERESCTESRTTSRTGQTLSRTENKKEDVTKKIDSRLSKEFTVPCRRLRLCYRK